MSDLEYIGKIKGMKTLKQMIESKDVVPASELAKNKAAAEAQEKAFEEAGDFVKPLQFTPHDAREEPPRAFGHNVSVKFHS